MAMQNNEKLQESITALIEEHKANSVNEATEAEVIRNLGNIGTDLENITDEIIKVGEQVEQIGAFSISKLTAEYVFFSTVDLFIKVFSVVAICLSIWLSRG
jgi:hypothetical protein